MFRITILSVLLCTILLCSCNRVKEEANYISQYGYVMNNHPGSDGIYCKVEIQDSSLFFFLLINADRIKFRYHGPIYDIDSIKFLYTGIGVDKTDSSLVFAQSVVPKLWNYNKRTLDSLFAITEKELVVELYDSTTNRTWTFKKGNPNFSKTKKGWFKHVPPYFFIDTLAN